MVVGTMTSGGVPGGETALCTWFDLSNHISAQRLQNFGTVGATTNLGGACGTTGAVAFNHAPGIGSSGFRCSLTGVPATALAAIFSFSAPAGNVPLRWMCVDPVLGDAVAADRGGASFVEFPIPCLQSLIGQQFETQWSVIDFTQTPCVLFPGLAFVQPHAADNRELTGGRSRIRRHAAHCRAVSQPAIMNHALCSSSRLRLPLAAQTPSSPIRAVGAMQAIAHDSGLQADREGDGPHRPRCCVCRAVSRPRRSLRTGARRGGADDPVRGVDAAVGDPRRRRGADRRECCANGQRPRRELRAREGRGTLRCATRRRRALVDVRNATAGRRRSRELRARDESRRADGERGGLGCLHATTAGCASARSPASTRARAAGRRRVQWDGAGCDSPCRPASSMLPRIRSLRSDDRGATFAMNFAAGGMHSGARCCL